MVIQIETYEEERLFFEELLKQSISDYLFCKGDSEEYINVCIWLFDDSDNEYPTINDICRCLDLDKFRLRLEIKKMLDINRTRMTEKTFTQLLIKCTKTSNIEIMLKGG